MNYTEHYYIFMFNQTLGGACSVLTAEWECKIKLERVMYLQKNKTASQKNTISPFIQNLATKPQSRSWVCILLDIDASLLCGD